MSHVAALVVDRAAEYGNAQAIENIKNGYMTGTAWEDTYAKSHQMAKLIKQIKTAGAGWTPKAAEAPAVLIAKDNVEQFIKERPDAVGK